MKDNDGKKIVRIRLTGEQKAIIRNALKATILRPLDEGETDELLARMMPALCKSIAHGTDYEETRELAGNNIQLGLCRMLQAKFGIDKSYGNPIESAEEDRNNEL